MRDILIRSYVSSHAFINVENFCKTSLFSFYKTYEFFNIKRYFVLKHFIINIKYSNYVKSRFCAIMQIIPITMIRTCKSFAIFYFSNNTDSVRGYLDMSLILHNDVIQPKRNNASKIVRIYGYDLQFHRKKLSMNILDYGQSATYLF